VRYTVLNIKYNKWKQEQPPAGLLKTIAKAAQNYPYFIKLTGFPNQDSAELLRTIISSMDNEHKRLSYTEVKVNPRAATAERPVTAYSRTHEALAPHTDSTYLTAPHELVAFLCGTADKQGGETLMVPVDDIVKNLSDEDIGYLKESYFDFGRGKHSIIFTDKDGKVAIRYYRAQLDHISNRGDDLLDKTKEVLSRLDVLLDKLSQKTIFKLHSGEAVLMNNMRVLHGRQSFPETSDRIFYRYRHHIDFNLKKYKPNKNQWIKNILSSWLLVKASSNVSGKLHSNTSNHTPITDSLLAGREFAQNGDFITAKAVFTSVLQEHPKHYEALLALSAIAYVDGDYGTASNLRKQACEYHPQPNSSPTNSWMPQVMKVRGLKDIKYTYKKGSKGYYRTLQRGHFSLSALLKIRESSLKTLNIYDASLKPQVDIPDNTVVINTIACADRMAESLASLSEVLKTQSNPKIVNHPDMVMQTSRQQNYERLNGKPHIIFPKTLAVSCKEISHIKEIIHTQFEYPLIIRPKATHTGSGLEKIDTPGQLDEYFEQDIGYEQFYLIQWRDLKRADGLYNKIRVFSINGVLYPIAHLLHDHWNIHSGDRYSVMDKSDMAQTVEQDFLKDMPKFLGPDIMESLERVQSILNLDFFGIDFTVTPEGELFIFECNAAMRHNYDHVKSFPYTEPTLIAASNAFNSMVMSKIGN